MWKRLYEWARWLLLFAQESQRIRDDVDEIRLELEELTSSVRDLAHELRRNQEIESSEREKLILRLENELLRFERRLASKKPDDKR